MWIARNRGGGLFLWHDKPYRSNNWVWRTKNTSLKTIEIDENIYGDFKNLTWEDEPVEVSIIPKPVEKHTNERDNCYNCRFYKVCDPSDFYSDEVYEFCEADGFNKRVRLRTSSEKQKGCEKWRNKYIICG